MPAGTITALVQQTHDRERVNVYIDGEFAIGVALATVQREMLYRGKVLDVTAWGRLERAEADQQAWEAALRLLDTRPRAERELRDRLKRKQFTDDQVDGVLGRLREIGLLDDRKFAEQWIENRSAFRPKGAQALRQELLAKGIARDVVNTALDSVTPDGEAAQCLALAKQTLRRYRDAPDQATFQRRFGGFLARRGYQFATWKPILDHLWSTVRPDPVDDNRLADEEVT